MSAFFNQAKLDEVLVFRHNTHVPAPNNPSVTYKFVLPAMWQIERAGSVRKGIEITIHKCVKIGEGGVTRQSGKTVAKRSFRTIICTICKKLAWNKN